MDILAKIEEFLEENYKTEILKAMNDNEHSIVIDYQKFERFDPAIADALLEEPEDTLKLFQKALESFLEEDYRMIIRIKNLPESRNIRIRNLRAKHLNKLWTIEGTVKSASEVKPQVYEITYECPTCKSKIVVEQSSPIIQKPYVCTECGRKGDFSEIERKMMDMRWLIAIEPFEITTGEQPGEIRIFLKEDLTTPKMQKMTDPGNRLRFVGILKETIKRIKGKESTKMDMFLDALHVEPMDIEYEDIEITEDDMKKIYELAKDKDIYEKLKMSIAPGIYGFDEIKEAIVLQLFGGVPKRLPDGSRIRGNIHILITGDPGVGKSQILKLVSNVVPRGKYVSGKGVTGAGLTATVRKDETLGSWVLEAGALILCNNGVIAIDEFDKMNKDDQIAMHEAMSLETVSVAKASIVATLPAQTAVLAGANPKFGRFDRMMTISEQIQIPETLLSRFDMKFALKDKPDRQKDEELADHIIKSRTTPELIEPAIDVNLLRKYIAYARKINDIEITEEAANKIKEFYVDMRNRYASEEGGTIAITLRQYEALIRLAEASAKVRLDNKVRLQDAERAIRLMKYSLSQLGMDYETGKIDIDRVESSVPASKRKKLSIVLDIISTMQKGSKDVAIEDVKAEAEERGIENAEEIIDSLKRQGMIFEPRSGFVRKI